MSFDGVQRVIVGGGHFVENGGRLVQESIVRSEQMVKIVERALQLNEFGVPNNIPVGARTIPTLVNRTTNDTLPIRLVSDVESNAWRDYNDFLNSRDNETIIRESALTVGSAASGDLQGVIEHGTATLEAIVNDYVSEWDYFWSRVAQDRP